MFKNKIKKLINHLLSPFDLEIIGSKKSKPFNLINKDTNALAAYYLAGQKEIIINIDMSQGRTNQWFDLSDKSLDPNIFAIRNAIKKNLIKDDLYNEILSTLLEKKSLVSYNNAAEFLDVDNDVDENISHYPWWAEVNPWDNTSFDEQVKYYPEEVKKNREKNGMTFTTNDPNEIINQGVEDSVRSHAMQYAKLTEKIKKNGFKHGGNYGYITAEIFIKKNEMRWKPGREGNHRTAIVAALGYKSIPVLINKIIKLDDLEYWPNVMRGTFSANQAKQIFNSVFDAKPSKIYHKWIEKMKSYV